MKTDILSFTKFFVAFHQVIAVITPTPRTFSDIFAPRAPLLLVKEYEDKPYQEPTTTPTAGRTRTSATAAGTSAATADTATKTATALATLKAIISQVQNKVGSIVFFYICI
jgi:hypothetical protein